MRSLFVCGTGKCGTTLLANIIAGHEDVLNLGETHTWHQYSRFIKTMRRRFIKGLMKTGYREAGAILTTTELEKMLAYPMLHFFQELYSMYNTRWLKRTIMDKTPHNLRHTRFINAVYPLAHFIHIIRDPLDVFASTKNTSWGLPGALEFADWYCEFMHSSLEQWEHLSPDRKLVIPFDDLILAPEYTTERLEAFLELTIPEHRLIKPGKAHVGRYKHDLSIRDQKIINGKCQKFYLKWKELL